MAARGAIGKLVVRTTDDALRSAALPPPISSGTRNEGAAHDHFRRSRTRFEAKFARDEEMAFRITARRNRLLGQWAARQMELTPEETDAYAKAVVQADFEEAGDEDVIRKLLGDLTAAGVEIDEGDGAPRARRADRSRRAAS